VPWTCTRRPRTSSSTSAETAFHGSVGDTGGGRDRPGRGRGPRIIGLWIGAVALIAGAALVGGQPDASPRATAIADADADADAGSIIPTTTPISAPTDDAGLRPIGVGGIVRREIGEDGLMGGLPFRTPAP
jgi:hypothetical protein